MASGGEGIAEVGGDTDTEVGGEDMSESDLSGDETLEDLDELLDLYSAKCVCRGGFFEAREEGSEMRCKGEGTDPASDASKDFVFFSFFLT